MPELQEHIAAFLMFEFLRLVTPLGDLPAASHPPEAKSIWRIMNRPTGIMSSSSLPVNSALFLARRLHANSASGHGDRCEIDSSSRGTEASAGKHAVTR